MVSPAKIAKIAAGYDPHNIRIASLGGHSALDVCRGAKAEGFETVVVAQRGREKTFTKYYKTRSPDVPSLNSFDHGSADVLLQNTSVTRTSNEIGDGVSGPNSRGCVDHIILVDKFADIVKPEVQKQLRELNAVFVHSRYFWVYCDYQQIENDFLVPIFGNRVLVRKEERNEAKNQYFLLQKAGIKIPKQFSNPADIDRLVLVKASEAERGYERAFFLVNSYKEYQSKSQELIKNKTITANSLQQAVIEEFVVGPQINLNFFYSPLQDEVELLGTDIRRQTNIDGILRMTAPEQIEALKHLNPKYIENGHIAVTIKESLIEKAYQAAENFVKTVKQYYPPGMIGPFALQGAVTAGPPTEELVIFDVSLRIPGSPGTMFTPYAYYMFGESLSVGRRIALEIKQAVQANELPKLLT